jgi:hypothetical protein
VTGVACSSEESLESSLDILAAHKEEEDSSVDLRMVEGNHCSLEALVLPVYHFQIPYE